MSRMFDRIAKGEIPVGTVTLANGPEYIEILGYTGMDFVCIDMMLTSIDWKDAADLVRAANRYDVTPWIRLQGFPWGGKADPRSTADVLRALSIGAECVTKSVDSPEEAEALLAPASDWHRRVYIYTGDARGEEEIALRDRLARDTLIFPLVESLGAANRIDEIVKIKGLRALFLGMGDLSRVMGHPGEPHHPEMRAFVKKTVELARKHEVIVIANTGRQDTPNAIADAVHELWDIGVKVVWIPYPTYILSRFYADTTKLLDRKPSLVGAHA